jgi:hypothetical protein
MACVAAREERASAVESAEARAAPAWFAVWAAELAAPV